MRDKAEVSAGQREVVKSDSSSRSRWFILNWAENTLTGVELVQLHEAWLSPPHLVRI